MKPRPSHGKGFVLRAAIVAACLAAVLFAMVLSAIPQLHEQVHGDSTTVNHECAVTLLTAGNYQHTVAATISLAPPAPPAPFIHSPDRFFVVVARLDFSLLEHAPPALS